MVGDLVGNPRVQPRPRPAVSTGIRREGLFLNPSILGQLVGQTEQFGNRLLECRIAVNPLIDEQPNDDPRCIDRGGAMRLPRVDGLRFEKFLKSTQGVGEFRGRQRGVHAANLREQRSRKPGANAMPTYRKDARITKVSAIGQDAAATHQNAEHAAAYFFLPSHGLTMTAMMRRSSSLVT